MICWAQLASSTSGTTKQPSQPPNISSKLYKAKIAQPVKCVFKMQIAHTEIQEKNIFIIVINNNRNKASFNSMQGLMHFPNARIY